MNSFGTNTLQPLNVCKVWTAILDMVNGLMRVQDIQYIWNSEDLAVVSVSPRSCKACALYEDRKFPLKKVNGPVADVSLHKSQTPLQQQRMQLSAFGIALYLTSLDNHICCFMPEITQFAGAAATMSNLAVALACLLLACLLTNCSFSG